MPYYLLYGYICFSILLNTKFKPIKKQILGNKAGIIFEKLFSYECLILTLFMFAAFRGNGDGDYFNYLNGVKYVNSFEFVLFPSDYPFEIGFRILSYISNSLTLNPQFVIMSMNFISLSLLYIFVNRRSKNKMLSIFVFFPIFLIFDMHHSRSAVALSSTLMFFDSFYDKKYLKSLLYLFLGYAFHKSALIMLVLVFVPTIENLISGYKQQKIVKTSLFFVVILYIFVGIFNPIKILIIPLNNTVTQFLYLKINSYLSDVQWSYKFSLIDPRLWLNMLILYISVNVYKSCDTFTRNLVIIQFFSVVSMLLFSHSTILLMRIYNFFNIFTVALIPSLILLNRGFKENTIYNLSELKLINLFSSLIYYSTEIMIVGYIIYTLTLISRQVPYRVFL